MGQLRKPFGLAWLPQRWQICRSPCLVAAVLSSCWPLQAWNAQCWHGALVCEVRKQGNSRKDALELEILSKDKSEVKMQ